MAFGAFDVLHPGHVHFLEHARSLGDRLVVVVARNSTVEKVKGVKPWFDERKRLAAVRKLECVDRALLGNKRDFHAVVRRVKPEVVALGYDQKADEGALSKLGRVTRLKAFKPRKYKSTLLKKKELSEWAKC